MWKTERWDALNHEVNSLLLLRHQILIRGPLPHYSGHISLSIENPDFLRKGLIDKC
jgi:hypothetical protein